MSMSIEKKTPKYRIKEAVWLEPEKGWGLYDYGKTFYRLLVKSCRFHYRDSRGIPCEDSVGSPTVIEITKEIYDSRDTAAAIEAIISHYQDLDSDVVESDKIVIREPRKPM